MARKKTAPASSPGPPSDAPPPRAKARGTAPTQIRLSPDDLARIDRIAVAYGQTSRAGAIRMAVALLASMLDAGQLPAKAGPGKSPKKSKPTP